MTRTVAVHSGAWLAFALLTAAPLSARADAVDALKSFVQEVRTGRASFTQTVTSPDGAKTKTSSGSFEFARPDRFRFAYTKPFEQLIVADGQKVWIYDADLNQVSVRKFSQALGTTPAALLAGGDLVRDFDLVALATRDGLDWAQATPKAKDGTFESMRVGFRGKQLAAVEIVDNFAQRSRLTFAQFALNVELSPQTFKFAVPKGADVLEQ
ncbi:MAG: outer membrane lipoprotein chaperone LolA [Rhizobacter sp.]